MLPKPSAPPLTTTDRGRMAEDFALAFLLTKGCRLVARNYKTPGRGGGEIDLIVSERDGTLVFVEVRKRRGSGFGGAAASVGATKQRRLIYAAHHYLRRYAQLPPCRFDVVAVEGEVVWIRAAFEANGFW